MTKAYQITILGMVQGIGFRPFIAKLAEKMGIEGNVRNSDGIVIIVCKTDDKELEKFIENMQLHAPAAAHIMKVEIEKKDLVNIQNGFTILKSSEEKEKHIPILPPDAAICENCKAELLDAQNRRFKYPFISCCTCGPRYSIMESLPYDRENITMREFEMCDACKEEYTGSENRRRHAQTISCRDCGPQLLFQKVTSPYDMEVDKKIQYKIIVEKDKALAACITLLQKGGVLACKGIGGYLLCCKVSEKKAVQKIRTIKQREKKPFAVMFESVEQLRQYAEVSKEEADVLASPAAPIVLVRKKEKEEVFLDEICGNSPEIGAFLPYTGIQLLLIKACGPLVMTSANRTCEPIIYLEQDMFDMAERGNRTAHVDGIAWNTRKISAMQDDSLVRIVKKRPVMIRRSRGYVPLPILCKGNMKTNILAMGGDLKGVFALAAGDKIYLSQYFGDLDQYSVQQRYSKQLKHMEGLLHITPQAIVCDMHPGYLSGKQAVQWHIERNLPLYYVQHHHAHIASVMAEHGIKECIGVAMDGTGYGEDGAVWGSEFMVCQNATYKRCGHLSYLEFVGGDMTSMNAWQSAACHLCQMPDVLKLWHEQAKSRDMQEWDSKKQMIRAALEHKINIQKSSSMGRLFDTVCALLGLGSENSYEAECAIMVEQAAWQAHRKQKRIPEIFFPIKKEDNCLIADREQMLQQLIEQMSLYDVEALALGFHEAVAQMILQMCIQIREQTRQNTVALSGGVFSNKLLLNRTIELLEEKSFSVYWNEKVPSNDGGLALGQSLIAAQLGKKEYKKGTK